MSIDLPEEFKLLRNTDVICSLKSHRYVILILYRSIPQELVSMPTKSRDWKGIFISVLVILGVVAMVLLAIKIVTPPPAPPRSVEKHYLIRKSYEVPKLIVLIRSLVANILMEDDKVRIGFQGPRKENDLQPD